VVAYFGNNLADPRSELGDAHAKRGFEQLQLRSGWCWLQRHAATGAFPMRYYPATDTVKSCRRCNPILPLAKSSGPRRHGDSVGENRQ
jgi:hypothetical protein